VGISSIYAYSTSSHYLEENGWCSACSLKHILISIIDENIKNAWLEKLGMHFKRTQVQNNHTE